MKLKILHILFLCLSFIGLMGCEEATQALFECATAECVEIAVEHGADINAIGSENLTPLMWAAREGRLAVLNALIDAGADVNASNIWGNTAVMHAASQNHIPVLNALIARGANVNALNFSGYNALMWATIKNRLGAVEVLLTAENVDVNASARNGDTAFKLAYQKGYTGITDVLASAGADRCYC